MAATVAEFSGFGPDAMAFLDGLAADNSKAYFDAHRAVYDAQVHTPLKALVLAIGDQLNERVSPNISYEPKVGKSMFRINRDLRFSKDKTPYHTYLDAVFWEGESPRTSPGFILRIRADDVLVGTGVFGLQGAHLDAYRTAVLGAAGEELEAIVAAAKRSVRGAELSEPQRKRVPKGYDADHPRADWLRYDGFHMSVTAPTPASITTARFATWCVDRFAGFAALERWLVDHT